MEHLGLKPLIVIYFDNSFTCVQVAWKGREGKERERNGREWKGSKGKGKERKRREGKGREEKDTPGGRSLEGVALGLVTRSGGELGSSLSPSSLSLSLSLSLSHTKQTRRVN